MADLPHFVSLVLGDESNDGHGKTETYNLMANLSPEEIRTAANLGADKLGFNIMDFCDDYECSTVPAADWQKLLDAGFSAEKDGLYEQLGAVKLGEDPEEKVLVDGPAFAAMYLFQVRVGDPSFRFERLKNCKLRIGGYGLFT